MASFAIESLFTYIFLLETNSLMLRTGGRTLSYILHGRTVSQFKYLLEIAVKESVLYI